MEAALQVKQRFPLNDLVISSLTFSIQLQFHPHNVQQLLTLPQSSKILLLQVKLKKLDDEWRVLSFTDLPFRSDPNIAIDHFWGEVSALKDGAQVSNYRLLNEIATVSATLECSCLEPVFMFVTHHIETS